MFKPRPGRLQYQEAPFEIMAGLDNILHGSYRNLDELLARFFHRSLAPTLHVTDFPHLEKEIVVLTAYLGRSLARRTSGVNVLFYGPPGTGKTELARVAATELGTPLYEVTGQDSDGEPCNDAGRFCAYLLMQRLLKEKRPALVLFDEIEDVFPDQPRDHPGAERASGARKAWTNRLLERNPAPAIWISNRIGQIDAAFLRRFDFVLELKQPPKSVRRGILVRSLRGLPVSARLVDDLAGNQHLSPADLEKMARVTRVAHSNDRLEADHVMRVLAEQRLRLVDGRPLPSPADSHALEYDLEFLNTDIALPPLVDSLKRNARGTFCLYGPSGTGKTAFAQYLAKSLEKPLHSRRASDLLAPYIGETEQNIARMFQQAKDDGAFLLLDEADSFLQDRQRAQRSWEVTQVNEMLVQMENFEGVFVCSTNLMDSLDAASLRRFTFKIRFDYLTRDQRWALFARTLSLLGDGRQNEVGDECRRRLDRLNNLTPGDFALFLRQRQILAQPSGAAELLDALEREARAKKDGNRAAIGFL
jgi:SpoVK/Ycf46/Vps4 family AAA+-type ATPase